MWRRPRRTAWRALVLQLLAAAGIAGKTPEPHAPMLEDHYNGDDDGGPANDVERASEPSKQSRKRKAQRGLPCAWQTRLRAIERLPAKCTRLIFGAILGTVLIVVAAAVALGIIYAPQRTSDVTLGDPTSMPSLSSTGHSAEGHITTLTTVPEIVQGTSPIEATANDTTTIVVPRHRCSSGNYFSRDREKCMPCSGLDGVYCVLKRNCTEDTDAEYTCTYSV